MSSEVTNLPKLLTEKEAAAYLGVSRGAMMWLRRSQKVTYLRLAPRIICYRPTDLDAYVGHPEGKRIYIIPSQGCVKVGIAKNPNQRWKDLKTGNPFIEPIAFVSRKLMYAARIEKQIHAELRAHRLMVDGVATEWFTCMPEVAIAALERVFDQWNQFAKEHLCS